MSIKMIIQLTMGAIAFAFWSVFAWFDPSVRGAYLTFIISVVTTLAALVLRDMPTTKEFPQ